MNFGNWFTPKQPTSPGEAALAAAGAGGDDKKKGGDSAGSAYQGSGFDPTGLERAAKAAKILNASPHAKSSLEVIQEMERTKQMEFALQQTQYETYKAKLKIDSISEKYKEDTQYLRQQTEQQKRLAEHSNEMERKRELEKMRAQEMLHKKNLQDQLQLFEKQVRLARELGPSGEEDLARASALSGALGQTLPSDLWESSVLARPTSRGCIALALGEPRGEPRPLTPHAASHAARALALAHSA